MKNASFTLNGLHHVSALSAHIERTHNFYPRVLGLRPIIKTVSQDEPGMYHLFYGDGAGSPGSDLTVFDLPQAAPERHGNNSISCTTFRIHGPAAFGYRNSGVVDRHYFRSAYVREPNGILFELATEGPGFEVDGPKDEDRLSLPPSLEPRRREIEEQLKPLTRVPA